MPTRSIKSGFPLLALLCMRLGAQEASSGIAVPLTITGGGLYTHRLQAVDDHSSPIAGAFHAVLYPSLKLSSHWLVMLFRTSDVLKVLSGITTVTTLCDTTIRSFIATR